jgi:hypothetical protein
VGGADDLHRQRAVHDRERAVSPTPDTDPEFRSLPHTSRAPSRFPGPPTLQPSAAAAGDVGDGPVMPLRAAPWRWHTFGLQQLGQCLVRSAVGAGAASRYGPRGRRTSPLALRAGHHVPGRRPGLRWSGRWSVAGQAQRTPRRLPLWRGRVRRIERKELPSLLGGHQVQVGVVRERARQLVQLGTTNASTTPGWPGDVVRCDVGVAVGGVSVSVKGPGAMSTEAWVSVKNWHHTW